MNKFLTLGARIKTLNLTDTFKMSKNINEICYAVGRGRETGIYYTWEECKAQVDGVPSAKYRKFYSLEEAQEFVDFWKNYTSSPQSSESLMTNAVDDLDNNNYQGAIKKKDDQLQLPQPLATCNSPSPSKQQSESESIKFSNSNAHDRIDFLALSLRLDSFEKRFDSCLKEMGGLKSEIENLKADVKELRESVNSFSSYSCSLRKDRGGLLQTKLNFGQSRSYASMKNEADSGEPEAKRPKKRKFSRSESKDSKQGGIDDIVSRIKTENIDLSSFVLDTDDYVEVYTDGACHSNGKNHAKAGIGIFFGDDHPLNVGEPVEGSATNNSAEIQAARVAIELASKAGKLDYSSESRDFQQQSEFTVWVVLGVSKLKILTDSEFLINCATKWIHRWKKNGWTLVNGGQVKNRKELEKLDKAASKLKLRWEKVEAHAGIHGNEMADCLANEGAAKYERLFNDSA